MHLDLRKSRRIRRYLFYLLVLLAFLLLWCLFTILILFLQNLIFGPVPEPNNSKNERGYAGRGIQTVVGHYSGNLQNDKLRNLTDEDLNANNYAAVEGWGEAGVAVRLNSSVELIAEETFAINQFNLYVSDRISVNRSLPDIRKQACRDKKYPDAIVLPTTSIIIVYHNEAYSTLLRTLWSVVNRSPRAVLREIILVDDNSTRTFLKYPILDNALKEFPVPIKVLRSKERVGLIRARMMGAQEAVGEVLTFLDSHCECTEGWLEPLLARVKEERKTVPCPIIDVINDRTFQYQKGIELFRGGFNWNMQFRWYSMPSSMAGSRLINPTSPIESPTMAGGLFSIDRKYFEEIGAYDPGMDIWGGENLEMSFRIWQCGGRVEILPCSHVGHIFRKSSPHDFPGKSSGKVLNGNLIRVADVWMDEWKDIFYKLSPQASHQRRSVDVSERVELRKRLRCKSFRWYLNNIFTDHFYPMTGDFFGRIELSTSNANSTCLACKIASSGIKKSTTADCDFESFDHLELWLYTVDGRIKTDEHLCLSAVEMTGEWKVQLKECSGYDIEYWNYNKKGKTFEHRKSGLCLQQPAENGAKKNELAAPLVQKCTWSREGQQWNLRSVEWRRELQ